MIELDDFDKSSEGKTLQEKYSKVRWVWQLIGSDRPKLTSESFNESIAAGNPELNLSFDDFLEGGGASYLEPFWEGQTPSGKYPNGIIINAKNNNSEIITADWRDGNDTLVSEIVSAEAGVAFGSVVYLNIYTQNLYGHNIKIQLKDKDKIVRILSLGLTNADDKLHAAEYLDNGVKVEDRNEEDITKKEDQFIRAVSVHTTSKYPGNAKFGRLVDEGEDHNDNQVKKVPNVQKCKFAVFIDPLWEHLAGKELLIYPEIEHPNIPGGRKKLSDCTIKITTSGKEIKVENVQSNMVAVVSDVETDMAFFNPCKYTLLKGSYKGEESVFFDTQDPEKRFVSAIKYKVIAGDKKGEDRTLKLEMPNLTTEDCLFENDQDKNHELHAIKIDEKKLYPNLQIGYNNVSFSVDYPIPSIPVGESMIDEDNVKTINYPLELGSCATHHPVEILVYPAVSYELGFKLGTENPFYAKGTKSYVKKKYLGKWGFFDKRTNKKIRKEQQSQRKKDYKNNQQEVANGRLSYDQFEYFLEYGYDDVKQSNIAVNAEYPVFNIIESVMWIINTINLLSFDKEADEAMEEHKDKRNGQVRDRKKKRNDYLKSKGKTLGKFPFKIEVGQPTFAGTVKWNYASSKEEHGEMGMLYTINLKADPLIYIKGSLDLLFVATKIPYVGQAISAITAVADTVGSADDFWNEIVDFLKLDEENKIIIDVDYYLDMFVSGDIKLALETLKYHTVDRFSWGGNFSCTSEIKFGIEAGGSFLFKCKIKSINAKIRGEAYALWEIKKEDERGVICDYHGLYVLIQVITNSSDNRNDTRNNGNEQNNSPKQFLLHDGFSYEFKLD